MSNLSADAIQTLYFQARQDHAGGHRQQAGEQYQRILAADPNHAGALMMLASLLAQQKQFEPALELLARATAAAPRDPAPLNVLAVTLASVNRLEEAQAACRQSLALNPQQPQMQGWLGGLLLRLRQPEDAAAAFRAALAASQNSAEAHHGLACALRDMGDTAGAIASCRQAVTIKPEDPEPHILLVQLLLKAGEPSAALAAADQAMALHPKDEEVQFVRAAVVGTEVKSAPVGYVTAVFDNHAERYDTVLVDELKARSHEYVHAAVSSLAGDRQLDILDMGCGTGLCGPLFRPMARSMDGIDLSRAMLLKAKDRNVYDRLGTGDLVTFLKQAQPASYDLILAADVFVYVGDLAETFALAVPVLRPGGMLAFTVEAIDGTGFQLRQTMRFGHSLAYIQTLAARHGLTQRYAEQKPLRNEHGVPVLGWVVVLEKAA